MRLVSTATVLLALCAPAAAAALPDGTYRCTLASFHSGDIEISGNTYKGPAFDGKYEGTYDYLLMDSGTIEWLGPLGGWSSGGNRVDSTVVRDAGGGKVGFDVMILPEGSDSYQTASCSPQ